MSNVSTARVYSRATLDALLKVLNVASIDEAFPWYENRSDGLYLRPFHEIRRLRPDLEDEEIEADRWCPADDELQAALPYPFQAHHLAAFALHGQGFQVLYALAPDHWDLERHGGDADAAWGAALAETLPNDPRARDLMFEVARLCGEASVRFPEVPRPRKSDGEVLSPEARRAQRYEVRRVEEENRKARRDAAHWLLAAQVPLPAPSAESPADRSSRRLKWLRENGGDARLAGDSVHMTGRRGALADLVRYEQQAGRPASVKADVRKDIMRALKTGG